VLTDAEIAAPWNIDSATCDHAEIEDGVRSRIAARVRAGDDPLTAATEEAHRAVAQLDAAEAALMRELDALTIAGPLQ
jgi:hypothetical protein